MVVTMKLLLFDYGFANSIAISPYSEFFQFGFIFRDFQSIIVLGGCFVHIAEAIPIFDTFFLVQKSSGKKYMREESPIFVLLILSRVSFESHYSSRQGFFGKFTRFGSKALLISRASREEFRRIDTEDTNCGFLASDHDFYRITIDYTLNWIFAKRRIRFLYAIF